MPTIQTKHQQHHFNQVAHVIGAALRAFPRAIAIDTGVWSPETYARKLREAVEAKQLYRWPSKYIDDESFQAHAEELGTSIKTVAGEVKLYYGSKEGLRNIETAIVGQPAIVDQLSPSGYKLDLSDCDENLISGIVSLIAGNRFTPPSNFVVTGLTIEQTSALEACYPVGFVPVEDQPNTWQIIT